MTICAPQQPCLVKGICDALPGDLPVTACAIYPHVCTFQYEPRTVMIEGTGAPACRAVTLRTVGDPIADKLRLMHILMTPRAVLTQS